MRAAHRLRWKFLLNFPFGVFVGVQTGLVVAWMFDSELLGMIAKDLTPLVSGCAALLAASVTILTVLNTINNQGRLADEVRLAKLSASRAVLPIALSEIIEVCNNHIQHSIDRSASRRTSSWSFSETTQKTLKECIEFASGDSEAALVEMISMYQILMARLQDVSDGQDGHLKDSGRWSQFQQFKRFQEIANWLTLRCLAELLFPFARALTDKVARSELTDIVFDRLSHVHAPSGWTISNAAGFSKWYEGRQHIGHLYFSRSGWQADDLPL